MIKKIAPLFFITLLFSVFTASGTLFDSDFCCCDCTAKDKPENTPKQKIKTIPNKKFTNPTEKKVNPVENTQQMIKNLPH
ncbi:hypothetical protein KAH94_02725 [bacterium]|nr:hypothetical protein [bacterium]